MLEQDRPPPYLELLPDIMQLISVGCEIVFPDRVEAYQVKHATNPNDLYTLTDFTNPDDPREKRVFFEKFSNSWTAIHQQFPTKQKKLYLHTNHSLDAELFEVVEPEGTFKGPFIRGTHRKENSKKIRKTLKAVGIPMDCPDGG